MAKKSRALPEINAGSMADIAFLLLIFFIVATTMDVDSGIITKLPPMPDKEQKQDDSQIKRRNVFTVLVNAKDQLLIQDEWAEVTTLREKTKKFINNNGTDPNLSENPEKAVISLQNDRGTSYNMYIKVQNELKAAYNELRDEESANKFGKKFKELNPDQQKEIQKVYPMKISEAEPKDIGGTK